MMSARVYEVVWVDSDHDDSFHTGLNLGYDHVSMTLSDNEQNLHYLYKPDSA